MMLKPVRILLLVASLLLGASALFSQSAAPAADGQTAAHAATASQAAPVVVKDAEAAAKAAAEKAKQAAAEAKGVAEGAERVEGQALRSTAGDQPVENSEEEENSQFKYSPIVLGIAHKTGLSKQTVYWSFLVANFAILVGGAVWVIRKIMPQGFAPRKAEIRKALDEARRASAEAGARLGEIESRLRRLDAEIAEIRAAAEADFSHEEQRIKDDADRDAKVVVAAAEQEIAAAARSAQRELKAFAAGLAVDLAEKKIKVDSATDEALVRGFAARLGKDGHS
jgi:F-type H+-transporting ATPase subunit b